MVIHTFAHEAGTVLVLCKYYSDVGAFKRIHDREHLAAGNAEGVPTSGVGQPLGNQLRGTRHNGALGFLTIGISTLSLDAGLPPLSGPV